MFDKKSNVVERLEKKARQLRKSALMVIRERGVGWLGGSFSCADLITALYFYQMKYDSKKPRDKNRDRLVFSKAHSCEIVYSALAEADFFPKEELRTYGRLKSRLQVHVDCLTPGVDYSGGSLGIGLSFAVGTAYGARISVAGRHARYRVYCIVGDGECDEGQVWEAARNASCYHLDNLTLIVDHNKFQSHKAVEENLAEKFKIFGWETREIDGHNFNEIVDSFDWVLTARNKPQAIIAHTKKGKGCPFLEGTNCHAVKLTDEILRDGLNALG